MPLLKSIYSNGGSFSANESLDIPRLRITDGASDGATIAWNTSDQLAIDVAVANDSIQVGSNTNTDLVLNGAANNLTWDASASSLTNSTFVVPCFPTTTYNNDATDGGAISLTTVLTVLQSAGAETRTLAAPTIAGQVKRILFGQDGGDVVVTVTGLAAAQDVITFSELGQRVELVATAIGTWIISDMSPGDTTVQSLPTFA